MSLIRNAWPSLAVCAWILALSACATAPVPPSAPAGQLWREHRAQLNEIRHWRLEGRIGIITEDDSGSASLDWEQRGEAFSLRITAAFGRGLVAVEGSEDAVTLRNREGEQITAGSAESLIWRETGWWIPVSDLRYWVLGLPGGAAGEGDYRLDDHGRLVRLESGGWRVEYRAYDTFAGRVLPDKIRLESEQLTIKLAISDWTVLPDPETR